ncbi:hypothetical protein BO79DRAFT_257939 [Aspergillus costaricaensis CBS 115574]|uniref:Uncharacterized protein n=1 Tax=Aspergillus costaricaensis CBS 115574 TaxID=1448317 RepID=A0ACD1I5M9_9EURO|nr:hypothetical protein BO79DRAFT_257939 [Aspergillus costaricaensis CBS 115574]RAK85791.1 hypothetical protein BO79DRAFT_257939 [Aspergillus costaricaensis CBS 115574]
MSSIHFLSLETRQIILGYLDIDSLPSAICSCRPFYLAYKGYEAPVLKTCLYTTITPEILPYAILTLDTAKSAHGDVIEYHKLIRKRLGNPTETLRKWSWDLCEMKELLFVHRHLSFFIDDCSKKALEEFHNSFGETEVCVPLSRNEWARIARSFYAHLVIRQACLNCFVRLNHYQYYSGSCTFESLETSVAEKLLLNCIDLEQLYIVSAYFGDIKFTEGVLPITWRLCNTNMEKGIAGIFRERGRSPVPNPNLAQACLSSLSVRTCRAAFREDLGTYKYGIVMWDKDRMLNSRLKDIYRTDCSVPLMFYIYESMMVSSAEQNNNASLNETAEISTILPEKKKTENKATAFFDGSPQQPGCQAVSRAVSHDLMSWCSDELRAVKKEKAMRSDLSIGAHHPGTSWGSPLGPVSSCQPYSRVCRWEN